LEYAHTSRVWENTLKERRMFRKKKHIREVQKYLDMLMLDQVNLTIQASRFGWNEEIQNQVTNTALLIRKYERRLRLIRM
jgi:PP-loop superfamily ATP-utilizing enzyme